jgi:hypothetical protein
MKLATLLLGNPRDQITEGESLPEYLNRLRSPSRPEHRSADDAVAYVLAQHRNGAAQEREERDVSELRQAMAARRAAVQDDPKKSTRLAVIEARLQMMGDEHE